MGGKHRQGPKIAEFVHRVLQPDQWYVEPFCGAMGVAHRVNHNKMILADVSQSLMTMWKEFQRNPDLQLPDTITEEEYLTIKKIRDPNDWRTAYCGFGMSFGSKLWGGYARNGKGTNYALNLSRSTNIKRSTNLKRSTLFKRDRDEVLLFCQSYDSLVIPSRSVIYVDPPYANRVRAHDFGTFDHDRFWDWCREKVSEGHVVLATEFITPADFMVLHSWGDTVVRHYSGKPADETNEVLVCHESQRHLFNT